MLPDDHDMHNDMHHDMHHHGMHHRYDVFNSDHYHDRNQNYMSGDRRNYGNKASSRNYKAQMTQMIDEMIGSPSLKQVLHTIVAELADLEEAVHRVQDRLAQR